MFVICLNVMVAKLFLEYVKAVFDETSVDAK